jgi:dolichol-phosphate mannosyltransferase
MRDIAIRLARFGTVGVSGVAVNLAAFWILSSTLRLHYLIAGPLAIELAFLSNYALNNSWTFADRRSDLLSTGLLRCQIVSGGGLLLNLVVLHLCVSQLGLPSIVGNLIGIGIATAWNFSLSLGWTWRPEILSPATSP